MGDASQTQILADHDYVVKRLEYNEVAHSVKLTSHTKDSLFEGC